MKKHNEPMFVVCAQGIGPIDGTNSRSRAGSILKFLENAPNHQGNEKRRALWRELRRNGDYRTMRVVYTRFLP